MLDAVVPEGPVILVGHSMGGMTIVALAEQHPELFGDRIVGTALISTTAGGLDPSRVLLPMVPTWAVGRHVPRTVAVLARGHRAVDGIRRLGRDVALVGTDKLAFGDDVPASYVAFVDKMLSATPFEVVAEFFPSFGSLDKFDAITALGNVPTADHLRHRRQADLDRSQPQAARQRPRLDPAGVPRSRPHGPPGAPQGGQRRAGPDVRGGRSGGAPVSVEIRSVGPEAAADVLAVVRHCLPVPPAPRPAGRGAGRDRGRRSPRSSRCTGVCWRTSTGSPSARCCSTRSGRRRTSVGSGSPPRPAGHGVAAALIEAAVEAADEVEDLTVVAREELPADDRVLGAAGIPGDPSRVAQRRAAPPAADPRRPGARCRGDARPRPHAGRVSSANGDLIVLSGGLGAGKTTFTQGLGAGLEVRGDITSPTFVIARVHPSLVAGPDLVHVDAYRLRWARRARRPRPGHRVRRRRDGRGVG